jgi:hypothetical protein
MQNRPAVLFVFSLIFFSFTASGQKMVNSPFSRFNLGSLEPAGSFRSISMGGTGTAMRDNNSIYFSNPASYSSLDTNSFVFDFGIDYGINILSDGTTKHLSEDLNFNHLLMGFPIAKGFGIATGIASFSNGYYKISDEVLEGDPDYDPITGEYTSYHNGEGGFTSFFIGSGLNITKNISAGINMTILFGNIERSNDFIFSDYYNVFHNTFVEKLELSGLNFNYGIQYNATLFKDFLFTAGVSLNTGKHYNSEWEKLSLRFTAYTSNDTLSNDSDNSTKAYIPGTMRIGLSFGKKNKFVAALDYISTGWSEAKIHGADGFLANSRSILFGVEYIPEKFSNYSYVKRMEYRLGGHIEDNYLIINGTQVKDYGISLGVGLPMPLSLSKTNIYVDFTRKSVPAGNMIHNENYITMGISLNFYDFWFRKFRYN